METQFINAYNEIELKRFPYNKNLNLQAWDAADTLLLDHLKNQNIELVEKNILIFNDSFGALTIALSQHTTFSITDSIVSQLAMKQNVNLNKICDSKTTYLNSLNSHTKIYDIVLIKAPKTLDFLRYFLASISNNIHSETQIIVAGMVKNMPKSLWTILEEMIGKTSTSLTKKKAKLIFANVENKTPKPVNPITYIQENTDLTIFNHSNVFSKSSLDIGTRFLLQSLPKYNGIESIIDLGCGNGIVGLNLAIQYPDASVTFTDESYMAVESARLTCSHNLKSINQHHFFVDNSLNNHKHNSIDLIVCNPPFHQSHSIGTHIALQMFKESYKTLKNQGRFIVVANRHLPYYAQLKRIFGNVRNLANNQKFLVLEMIKKTNN